MKVEKLSTVPKKIRRQIIAKLQMLAAEPYPRASKKLRRTPGGEEPVYRLRSGKYRILYAVRCAGVVILDINHRKDVYR